MNSILVLLIILLTAYVICECMLIEKFTESEEGMIIFNRLNSSLIKKYKINNFITLDDKDFVLLFKLDNVIRIIIPTSHTVRIIYKEKDSNSFTKTIMMSKGSYDLARYIDNQEISQIDVFNEIEQNIVKEDEDITQKVYFTNSNNDILYISRDLDYLNWDWIYNYYGLDDYYINYPWGRNIYYYRSYPRWNRYIPSYLVKNYGSRRFLGTKYYNRHLIYQSPKVTKITKQPKGTKGTKGIKQPKGTKVTKSVPRTLSRFVNNSELKKIRL